MYWLPGTHWLLGTHHACWRRWLQPATPLWPNPGNPGQAVNRHVSIDSSRSIRLASVKASARIKRIQRNSIGLVTLGCAVNYIQRSTLAVANPLIRHDPGLPIGEWGCCCRPCCGRMRHSNCPPVRWRTGLARASCWAAACSSGPSPRRFAQAVGRLVFCFFGAVYMGWVYQAWLPGYLAQRGMSPVNRCKVPVVIGLGGMEGFTVVTALIPTGVAVDCPSLEHFHADRKIAAYRCCHCEERLATRRSDRDAGGLRSPRRQAAPRDDNGR